MREQSKFLNAINVLAMAKTGALAKISKYFKGDWQKAWSSPKLRDFLPKDAQLARRIDPDTEWKKIEKEKIELITINDKNYPKLLKHIADPPFLLYLKGTARIFNNKCFAVVGTRALSDYGRRATPYFTSALSRAGLTIISGLALGVDSLAHKAALEAGGVTVAVLGTGIDDKTIYPKQNTYLAKEIVKKGGAVISEYAPGAGGTKFTFPQRNRIISGLSKGVLIIEADIKSGALITAYSALDQNRDLFAVPGNIFVRTSQGTNSMISKGAKLVMSPEDILSDYGFQPILARREIKPDNEIEALILKALDQEKRSVDEIIRRTGHGAAEINAALASMEFKGKIKSLGGDSFVVVT